MKLQTTLLSVKLYHINYSIQFKPFFSLAASLDLPMNNICRLVVFHVNRNVESLFILSDSDCDCGPKIRLHSDCRTYCDIQPTDCVYVRMT